jgi:hypothetical protein
MASIEKPKTNSYAYIDSKFQKVVRVECTLFANVTAACSI